MTKWADYSFATVSVDQLKANGVVGVLRYLSPDTPSTSGKILRPAERDALLNAGIDIALNFEWYQGRCNEGYNSGLADGHTALSQAQALGYPAGKCIYFSHDTGVYNMAAIDAYFKGVHDAFGAAYEVGAYGSYLLIQHLHSAGLISKGWQTLAWSNGNRDTWAVIYQNGAQILGGSADLDEVTSTDIGSWLDGPPEVDLTPQESQMLTDIHNWLSGGTAQGQVNEGSTIAAILPTVQSAINKLNALAATDAALGAAIQAIQSGQSQVDPVALANALAAHIKVVAS